MRVLDLRAFADATVKLPPIGVVLVVGANNSGKTSLLSAIDVAAGTRAVASATRVGATRPLIEATFDVTEQERLEFLAGRPEAGPWLETRAFDQFRITWTQDADGRSVIEQIALLDAAGSFRPIAESKLVASTGTARAARLLSPDAFLSAGPAGAGFESGFVDLASGGIGDHIPWQVADLSWFSNLLAAWRQGVYHFDALRQGTERSTASRGELRLSPTGADLPAALLHLKSNDDPAWDIIVRVMQEIVPDVGVLAVPVVGDQVSVAFHDPFLNAKQNVKDLGTGVEQLLMTVYVGVRQPAGSVVIVEEPETNLHPAAQRSLLRYIREWAEDKLFILATHSTVFLDETLGQNRVVLVERQGGAATVREASVDLQDVLLSLGIRLSDVLSAERILLVEGDSDAEILRAWFPSLSVASGTAIAGMGGGDRAWDVDIYTEVSSAVDRLDRRVIVIRDRDELPVESVAKLEEGGLVHVLARRELENYLIDDVEAIKRVLDRQAVANPESRHESEDDTTIERLLREAADAVQDTVILKRVVARIKNVRLVSRQDVKELTEGGAILERLLSTVEERLQTAEDLRAQISGFWEEEARYVQETWGERWRELAPGAELLSAVWKAHAGTFEKGRDGVMIAGELEGPPTEIRDVLARLEE